MKKLFKLRIGTICFLSSLAFIIFFISSCKKLDVDNPQSVKLHKSIIEVSKSYFSNIVINKEKQSIASRKALQKGSTQKGINVFDYPRMQIINNLLNWDAAKQYDTEDISYVIAPVKHDAKPFTNKNYEAAKFMAFYLDKSDSVRMKVIEILGAKGSPLGDSVQQIASTAFINMFLNKSKSINNINCNVIFYNENYVSESNFKITNGIWSKSNFKLQIKIPTTINSNFRATDHAVYEYWHTVGYFYDLNTGEILSEPPPMILNSWQVCISGCDGNNSNDDPFGDGPIDGGGVILVPPVKVDSVINKLDSACFVQFVNKIGDTKLKNQIAQLYQKTFVGFGNTFNISFEQQSGLKDPYGNTVPSGSHIDINSPNTWVIVLNSDFSSTGTQEAWGQAILHELIHGFIDQNNLDFNSTTTWQQAHADMLNNWIIQIRDAMMEIYSMPQYDATAIAFQGLDDILKTHGVNPTFKQNMVDWVFTNYNINLPDAEATVDQYFSGTKGTKCH